MFVKIHSLKSKGGVHRYASLAETSRTPKGPRQRTVYYLTELNASASPRRVRRVQVLDLSGRKREVCLIAEDLDLPGVPDAVRIRMDDISVLHVRQFGNCYLGWHLWRSLRLDEVFPSDIGVETADIPWSRIIGLLAVCRLCVPASHWILDSGVYLDVGLHDLLKVPLSSLDDKRLSRCVRLLTASIPKLHGHLKRNCGTAGLPPGDVLLYYVRRASSQPGVILSIVLSRSGAPVEYDSFAVADDSVAEFDRVLGCIAERYQKARSICLFGKDYLPPEHADAVKKRGIGSVLVVPRSHLPAYGAELFGKTWDTAVAGSDWKYLSCNGDGVYAMARYRNGAREDAAGKRAIAHFEARLAELDRNIAEGSQLDPEDIASSLNRELAPNAEAAKLYRVELEQAGGRIRLVWYPAECQHRWYPLLQEYRVVRMDIGTDAPDALAAALRTMDSLERVFGSLGEEIHVVPGGQLDPRSKASATLAFLSYVLLAALQQLLQSRGLSRTPESALSLLSSVRLFDVALPTTDGRQVILRRLTKLSDEQSDLIRALGLAEPQFSSGVYEEREFKFRAHAMGGR